MLSDCFLLRVVVHMWCASLAGWKSEGATLASLCAGGSPKHATTIVAENVNGKVFACICYFLLSLAILGCGYGRFVQNDHNFRRGSVNSSHERPQSKNAREEKVCVCVVCRCGGWGGVEGGHTRMREKLSPQ